MTFQQFDQFVIGWAGDRKILKNGKPYTQGLKLLSEWGETRDVITEALGGVEKREANESA